MSTEALGSILGGAAIELHFGGDEAPRGCAVTSISAPLRTVVLDTAEAARSKLHGGTGKAAAIGGVVTVTANRSAEGRPDMRALSICLRVRDPSGAWNSRLLREDDPEKRTRYSLGATEQAIVFELFTDYRVEPLRLEAPFSRIERTEWHDIIARFSFAHVELFIDGMMLDEEWPVGALPGLSRHAIVIGDEGREGFKGLLQHLFVWDRPLSDGEIGVLAGGGEKVARRGRAFADGAGTQYQAAPGGGWVGDCFPFFHEGVYHFYYLFDRRHHRSKFGLGAHQWAHASTSDLVHWERHPLAIPITEEHEGSICTGSVFVDEGTWYGFYATRLLDRTEHLSIATSSDGIHFSKTEPNLVASPALPYRPGPFRDPNVFRDPADGLFHMLMTAELEDAPVAGRGGCLAHLVSSDLRAWTQHEPFLVTGYADQPECSELFRWHDWYYLVFSHYGVAHYRMSRSLFGPWRRPPIDTFDGPQARVMKSAPFTGDRRIGAAFVAEGGGYAGRAVFREYLQQPDGTLATRWPEEMVPRAGNPVHLAVRTLCGEVTGGVEGSRRPRSRAESHATPAAFGAPDSRSLAIDAPEGFAAAALEAVPRDMLLRVSVTADPATECYGIGLRGRGRFEDSLILQLEPGRRKAGWRRGEDPSWRENETAALYEVDGLAGPIDVAVVALGELFDVCLSNRRTLVSHYASGDGDRLFLFCQNGRVRFERVTVQPILAQ